MYFESLFTLGIVAIPKFPDPPPDGVSLRGPGSPLATLFQSPRARSLRPWGLMSTAYGLLQAWMLMIVGNLQPPKHVTDMADNTIKTTPKDSYWPIVSSRTFLGASHE